MTAAATTDRARHLYRRTAHVVGQVKARKQLAVLLERQLMVAEGALGRSSGAIIAGRTGVGKSYLIRTMCKELGLPFVEANATQFTDVGFVGADLSQMFLRLTARAAEMIDEQHGRTRLHPLLDGTLEAQEVSAELLKRDDLQEVIELAQVGVVLLDEGDKWMQVQGQSADPQSRNVGRKLQAELLKMVEGSNEYIKADADDEDGTMFDTTRVMIILAGAFVGLPGIAAKRLEIEEDRTGENPHFWELIEPQDFVKFGMIPELAGRLSTIIFLRPLRPEHLAEIMDQEGGIVEEYRQRFEAKGCTWGVDHGGLLKLAQEALEKGMGARALEHVMWQTFSEALFEAGEKKGDVRYRPGMHRATIWLNTP